MGHSFKRIRFNLDTLREIDPERVWNLQVSVDQMGKGYVGAITMSRGIGVNVLQVSTHSHLGDTGAATESSARNKKTNIGILKVDTFFFRLLWDRGLLTLI